MKKHLVAILSLIIAVVFIGGSAAATSYEMRPWPESVASAAFFRSDLVIEGKILRSIPLDAELRERGLNDENSVLYEVRVNDIWFGEYGGRKLRLVVFSETTQPRKGDKAVFLARDSAHFEDLYYLTHAENSVYIINPPRDLLFPLSPAESCMVYDGQPPLQLKMGLQEALEQLEQTGTDAEYANGAIAKPYRDRYYASHPEEE